MVTRSARPRVVAVTQARMTSTRLPGKVLMTVQGKPLLEHHLERVRRMRLVDETVVATTTNAADEPIVALCKRLGVPYVRGSEADVLSRYQLAAQKHPADVYVRVTSDCPILDPVIGDKTIQAFLDRWPEIDYVSNRVVRTYPVGLDTEVFTREALEIADREATEQPDREHVTLFLWRQPKRFRVLNVACDQDLGGHRWTVDTQEDFDLVRRLIDELYPVNPEFGMQDCLAALTRHPEWRQINQHVAQKWPL